MHRFTASTALLSLLVLTGCVAPTTNTTEPSTGFTSEDDAVAAAEDALDHYVAAINDATSRSDDELAPYDGIISSDLMDAEVAAVEKRGERTSFSVGEFDYFSLDVTQVELSAEYPTAFVRVRLCMDYRNVRWANAAGDDITAEDRPPWRPVEIAFVDDPDAPHRLLVDDVNWWVGYDFCPTPRAFAERVAPAAP